MEKEIWKECPLDNRYKISNLGNVKGARGHILKPFLGGQDYLYVSLGKGNKKLIHRLVMITFNYIEGCENLQVNHKDGNHYNNNLKNLEWVTPSENIQHSYDILNRKPAYYNAIKSHEKAVYSLNLETKEKKYFNSQTDCAFYYGCDKSNLTKYIDTEKVWTKYNIVIRRLTHDEPFEEKY